ncbi:MAG: DUF2281 domain-containing protein [Deltaproteobacteria bacterium]|nr:DUF2281 domain-containing protein [Deltaproteobacteria bacterium]
MTVKDAIKRELDNLPDAALPEVLDFVQFLEAKKANTEIAKAAQALSQRCFDKVWDNDEDAVYDNF